jgi:hypothetical protein
MQLDPSASSILNPRNCGPVIFPATIFPESFAPRQIILPKAQEYDPEMFGLLLAIIRLIRFSALHLPVSVCKAAHDATDVPSHEPDRSKTSCFAEDETPPHPPKIAEKTIMYNSETSRPIATFRSDDQVNSASASGSYGYSDAPELETQSEWPDLGLFVFAILPSSEKPQINS